MYNQYPQPIPMDPVRKNRLSVKSYLRNSNVLTLAVLYIISTVAAIITQILSAPIMSRVISNLAYEMDFDYPVSVSTGFSIPVLPVLMIISFSCTQPAGKETPIPPTPRARLSLWLFPLYSLFFCVLQYWV